VDPLTTFNAGEFFTEGGTTLIGYRLCGLRGEQQGDWVPVDVKMPDKLLVTMLDIDGLKYNYTTSKAGDKVLLTIKVMMSPLKVQQVNYIKEPVSTINL